MEIAYIINYINAHQLNILKYTDGGPIYAETNLNAFIVEPFNTISAITFLLLAVYWWNKLNGQYSRHIILSISLPLLFVGAIGGIIYHAFRSSALWLYLDWVPILAIGALMGAYFWYKILKQWWKVLATLPVFAIFHLLVFKYLPIHSANNISYALLGIYIIAPSITFLFRTRFIETKLIGSATAMFCMALFFRIIDPYTKGLLPMGTHFLWHTFGALSGYFLSLYVYKIEELHLEPVEVEEAK